jgi:hypothetical protein
MNHIFYSEFSGLLSEYKDAVSEDDKQIKEKLDKIVGLYENRSLEEREFADEITLEFSYIISLLKNKHRREMLDLSRKFENLESQLNDSNATFVPYAKTEKQSYFKNIGFDVLATDFQGVVDLIESFIKENMKQND